jgi:hypothetical protein
MANYSSKSSNYAWSSSAASIEGDFTVERIFKKGDHRLLSLQGLATKSANLSCHFLIPHPSIESLSPDALLSIPLAATLSAFD